MPENGNFTSEKIREAMKLAQSDTGKQLYDLLQKTQGRQLQSAMELAAAGDYDQVKQTLSRLLADPEARKLLERMGKL